MRITENTGGGGTETESEWATRCKGVPAAPCMPLNFKSWWWSSQRFDNRMNTMPATQPATCGYHAANTAAAGADCTLSISSMTLADSIIPDASAGAVQPRHKAGRGCNRCRQLQHSRCIGARHGAALATKHLSDEVSHMRWTTVAPTS
jgi:hypothetical protein